MIFVYILQSERDGGFYMGATENLPRRLDEHNRGKTRSVRHRRPLRLVYWETFDNTETARNREKQLKAYKGGEGLKKLLREGCQSG